MKLTKILLIFIAINSCNNSEVDHNHKVKDIQIEIIRFDTELLTINDSNFEEKWAIWKNNLEDLPKYYFNAHINMVLTNDSVRKSNILAFVSHPDVINYNHSINHHFSDLDEISELFNTVFGRYIHYFPDSTPPNRVIIINSFNSYGVDLYNEDLLIGLDFYLGESHPNYDNMWDYIKQRSNKKFIVPDALEFWTTSTFLEYNQAKNFLDELIYKGKIVYLMRQCMPNSPLEDILRFSKEDLRWCESNERNIWNEIIQMELIYETIPSKFRTFFNPAPFTKGMPKESPGRLGYWVGYQIIDNYMRNNEISLSSLMQSIDAQEILLESKYKP